MAEQPGTSPEEIDQDYDMEDDDFDLSDILDAAVNSGVGRLVALVGALSLPIFASLCAWLQDVLGIDLDPGPLSAFVASVVGGGALLIWQWLRARGEWEKKALDLLHDARLPVPAPPLPVGMEGDITTHPDWKGSLEGGDVIEQPHPLEGTTYQPPPSPGPRAVPPTLGEDPPL